MNDRDRKDLFTVEDPFEDEQAPAPAIAASTRSGSNLPNIVTFCSMLLLKIKTSCWMTDSSS